jgi:phosphatidylglycerophosphatase C
VAKRFKKEMLDSLERHKKEGAELFLVSANIPPVLLPVKEKFGFDALFCSELQIANDRATGKLSTPNCRGLEKLKRIESLLKEGVILEAYGDSEGDRQLLERANIPHWIR